MKYLLDSCAFIDLAIDASTLTLPAKKAFEDPNNKIYLSAASVWELGIKKSLGKLDFDIDGAISLLPAMGITILDITLKATLLVNKLPYHHQDPFDRIIIATAKTEALIVITSDTIFADYALTTLASR